MKYSEMMKQRKARKILRRARRHLQQQRFPLMQTPGGITFHPNDFAITILDKIVKFDL